MNTLILGASGQLGSELARLFPDAAGLNRRDIDVSDALALSSVLDRSRAELIINCTSYNLVDGAESEPDLAYRVNALAPRTMAKWCHVHGATLVHISTDYVFGLDYNRTVPYSETDAPGPLSAYALSKLAGEYYVQAECTRYYVVRTCGLYGGTGSRTKGNFIKTMLRLGRERSELRVVYDQRCTPTFARDLAQALTKLIASEQYGLFHINNAGAMSWFELASEVLRQAEIETPVHPISTAEFGAIARRPAYSVLDCTKFTNVTGFVMRHWRDAVREYVASGLLHDQSDQG